MFLTKLRHNGSHIVLAVLGSEMISLYFLQSVGFSCLSAAVKEFNIHLLNSLAAVDILISTKQ